MRIGYAKLGRSIGLDPDRYGFQGDAEAPNLLRRLALRHPDVTWVLVGKNSGGTMGLPNVENPWDGEWSGVTYNNLPAGRTAPDGCPSFRNRGNRGGAGKRKPSTQENGWFVRPEGVARDQRIAELIGQLDGIVVHIGQHGCSHLPIPPADTTWAQADKDPDTILTTPQLWARNYGTYLLDGLNRLGDRTDGRAPVIYLCADPRNYWKDRSLKWPTGLDSILAQYAYSRDQKHERFRDTRPPSHFGLERWCRPERGGELWMVKHRYEYGDLELMILPDDWDTWGAPSFDDRVPLGIATTSFDVGTPRRSQLVRDYLLAADPAAEVFGGTGTKGRPHWDETSLEDVPPGTVRTNEAWEFQVLLERWRATLALPAIGTTWTVAKPYQCFAANVACFMVGELDNQGWVLPTRSWNGRADGVTLKRVSDTLYSVREDWTPDELKLAELLRIRRPAEFVERAQHLSIDRDTWAWVVQTQRALLTRRWNEHRLETTIARRLGLTNDERPEVTHAGSELEHGHVG